jgi:hypothetical protein
MGAWWRRAGQRDGGARGSETVAARGGELGKKALGFRFGGLRWQIEKNGDDCTVKKT